MLHEGSPVHHQGVQVEGTTAILGHEHAPASAKAATVPTKVHQIWSCRVSASHLPHHYFKQSPQLNVLPLVLQLLLRTEHSPLTVQLFLDALPLPLCLA